MLSNSWPLRVSCFLLLTVPLAYGALQAARLAYADRLAQADTVSGLLAASRIEPSNADYPARIASLDPSRQDQLLEALRINPRNPSWWIMQSIRQEQEGDTAGAEISLLQATAVCRYYAPRWSLASFYYRQRNLQEFVRWSRNSLSVGYGDPEPIFRMADKLGLTSEAILRDIVPNDPDKIAAYLSLISKGGDIAAIYPAAAKLIDLGAKPHRNMVLDCSELLFKRCRTGQALALWNKAVEARWIDFASLRPESGQSLARRNFRGERVERGFDWKYSSPEGVSVSAAESDGSLRLEFSGKEPPNCELASQLTPLLPGHKYHLTVHYRSASIHPGSGLQISVVTEPAALPIVAVPLTTPADDPSEQSTDFVTAPRSAPAKLILSYSRSPGTTRIEGILRVLSIELTLIR